MNANRIFLFGLIAAICLSTAVAMTGSRGFVGASSAPHMSSGPSSGPRISASSATMPHTFAGSTSRPRIATGTSGTGSVATNHWSGNNNCHHHHHHHHQVVFIGAFGYPYWYDYYPYSYYDYNPVVYTDDGSLVAEVQQRLARAGYYYGPIDGVLGPRTQAAIRAYERAHGLRVDGMISQGLVATMGLR